MPNYENKIDITAWTDNSEIRSVLSAITGDGKEARFIGGCVRDHILGERVSDLDIATLEPPNRIIELLNNAGIKAITTGIKYGTVTAITSNKIEITTLRRDIKTDGRYAVVEYTQDWEQDAARRDFTINALSVDLNGNIFDYFTGQQDLMSKVIKFIGLAQNRINEDYLRILRYFRLIATHGLSVGDDADLQACVKNIDKILEISAERLRSELFKILSSNMRNDIVSTMYQEGILQVIIPDVTSPERFLKLVELESNLFLPKRVFPDPIRRLAALVETSSDAVVKITKILKLSKIEQKRLTNMKTRTSEIFWNMTNNELRQVIYKRGNEEVIDIALLNWASMATSKPNNLKDAEDGWLKIISYIQENCCQELRLPIKGQDVIDLGILPGKKISKLLYEVEKWWLNSGCLANRKACIDKLKILINHDKLGNLKK